MTISRNCQTVAFVNTSKFDNNQSGATKRHLRNHQVRFRMLNIDMLKIIGHVICIFFEVSPDNE